MKKRIIALLLVAVMFCMILAGCSSDGVMNGPSSDGSASNGEYSNGKTYEWKLASAWGEGSRQFSFDQRFCDRVQEMSNGRLKIKLYGAGQLCSTTEVFDLVAAGDVQVGSDAPQYWSGKNTAFDLLGYNVLGLGGSDYLTWYFGGEGYQLTKDLYHKYGLEYFYTAITNCESGIRSNNQITGLADLKGKNIRMSGNVIGAVLGKLGITSTSMTLDEAVDGLEKGVIDAMEYSSPCMDYTMQIYEIAKYWIGPGFHQTAAPYGIMFNQEAYDSLDQELKDIIATCAKANLLEAYGENAYQDAVATDKMIKDEGVTLTYFSDEDLATIENARNEVYNEMAAKNADFAKIAQSQMDYFKTMTYYQEDFLGDYSTTSIPSAYPNLG